MGILRKRSYEDLVAAAKMCKKEQDEAVKLVAAAYRCYSENTEQLATDLEMETVKKAEVLMQISEKVDDLIKQLEDYVKGWAV